MKKSKYIRFYAHCIPVIGHKYGCIYDLHRGNLYNVSNSILELISTCEDMTLEKVLENNEFQKTELIKYLTHLEENEIIFFTSNPKNFVDLDNEISKPFFLDTLYLEMDELLDSKLTFLNKKVENLGVTNIIFIFQNSDFKISVIHDIVDILRYSRIQYITFILPFNSINSKEIISVHKNEVKVFETIFFNSKKTRKTKTGIYYYKNGIKSIFRKRIRKVTDFFINTDIYLLGKQYNTYYYRTAYINNQGLLKNSWENDRNYGNIFVCP